MTVPWVLLISVLVAGGVGGLGNALIVDGGFKRGYWETLTSGQRIRRPGWPGNVFIGCLAGVIIWGLYGVVEVKDFGTLLRQVVATLVAGLGGSRVVTAEVDKRILNTTKDQLVEALKHQ
jgi:hypothetical protein